MPVNTITVGAAVTPTVIQTYISHYLNRRPLHEKPTAHISYHEGLVLVRRFLHYASLHTVEEIQAFTSQWVPVPRWVHVKEVEISTSLLSRSAEYVNAQLGPAGIEAVGGKTWWQWRREGTTLKADWIEMRKDYDARKQLKIEKGDRIMLYVHGGAYFFGSVDEHRYQMQRHARKLKARVLAPRYRLAPQFPFPCGLHDCLSVYLHLLKEKHDPTTIILAGDSAGGGMVMSMLVILRDQGIPLPAGAILISPWVDLTHSFPSLGGDGLMDYIPAHGFLHKPSMSWPPPNADDLLKHDQYAQRSKLRSRKSSRPSTAKEKKEDRQEQKEAKTERVRGFSLSKEQPDLENVLNAANGNQTSQTWVSQDGKYSMGPKGILSVQLDNEVRVEIKDQIHMYAANHLLTHPMVSPVLQPTLGGLPPLLIQTGGGELLRDEQIYLAHKAAAPLAYLPPPSNNQTTESIQAEAAKYRPTNVQLQVWDDLCHVCPTLSFTRPAKHMYRSIAQFGAWALARAQKKTIDILDDDDISFVSTDTSLSSDSRQEESSPSLDDAKAKETNAPSHAKGSTTDQKSEVKVGRAGDPLPPFEKHMIRQRIDRHGRIYPLAPKEELEALKLPPLEVGAPKKGPVSKWMKAQEQWNTQFAKQKIKIQKQRVKDMEKGFEGFEGELPPLTALAGRRVKGMKPEKPKKKSWGMAMWSGWGSSHDKATIVREEKADQAPEEGSSKPNKSHIDGVESTQADVQAARTRPDNLTAPGGNMRSRSHSRHTDVTDKGQTGALADDLSKIAPAVPVLAGAAAMVSERKASPLPSPIGKVFTNDSLDVLAPGIIVSADPNSPATLIPASDTNTTRPTKGGIAYPFSLKVDGPEGKDANASTTTLHSVVPEESQQEKELGAATPISESVNDQVLKERPGVERYFTAAPGVEPFATTTEDREARDLAKTERPPVERFETAQEDLSLLAKEKA